jgi:hypothetical protein
MMMETQEFIGRSHLDTRTLNAWIEAEWLLPLTSGTTFEFSDADLARARLIQDLKVDSVSTTRALRSFCISLINCTACVVW